MSRPTLSLLIPAYNAERFLPRLLASAHAQTEPFDEIWVYDDCSSDATAAVAESFGAKVLRGDVNVGCSAGKQALALHVETDWMHFHDADDELLPNFTAAARKWIERDDRDVVLFSYEYRDEATGELIAVSSFDDEALRKDPRHYSIMQQINPFCGLYRRKPLLGAGGYQLDPTTLYNEDVAFHIRLAFAGLRFAADPETSIINWRTSGSMSSANKAKCAIAHMHVMNSAWSRPDAAPYRDAIGQKLWKNAGILASFGEWIAARECVSLAASLTTPTSDAGKTWFRQVASFSPYAAIILRETAIRLLKPQLRKRN